MPIINTLPVLLAEMLADETRTTPLELDPVPHDVPLTVIEPVLVLKLEPSARTPMALSVPFAAAPVILNWPVPVAEMLEDASRFTPIESAPVPHEVPLNVSEPELVVTVAPVA